MLDLCCDETYGAMTNHDDGNDSGDNDRNKDKNDDSNVASGPGSDGPVFNPIATPRSRLGIAEDYWATTTTALQKRRHMYLHVDIYLPYK